MPLKEPLAVRFWRHVDRSGECWNWTGSRYREGYGQVRGDDRRQPPTRAHRAAWELTNGPVPDGLQVCHRCDNRLCVRPDHLFLGTHQDNMDDMHAKGRGNLPLRVARMARGELHPDAKLTAAKVAEARERHARGETYSALATAFGVSKPTMAHACQGRTWKTVGPAGASPPAAH